MRKGIEGTVTLTVLWKHGKVVGGLKMVTKKKHLETQKKQRTFPFSGETAMDWNFIILFIYRVGCIYEALLISCVHEFNIQLFKVLQTKN